MMVGMATLSGGSLVTGASSGLGERFAEPFRRAGAEVVATPRRRTSSNSSRRPSGSMVLAETLLRLPIASRWRGHCGSIRTARHARQQRGHVRRRADGGGLEEAHEVIQTDLVAVLDLCRLMAPLLFMSDGATVINRLVHLRAGCISQPDGGVQRLQGGVGQSDQAPCCSMGSTRSTRERTRPRVLSDRVDGRAPRPQLRREHRSPVVVGTDTNGRRAGRPALVPGIGCVELRHRTDPGG